MAMVHRIQISTNTYVVTMQVKRDIDREGYITQTNNNN